MSITSQIDQLVAQTMPAAGSPQSNLGHTGVSSMGTIAGPSTNLRIEYNPDDPEASEVYSTGSSEAATGEAAGPAVVSESALHHMQDTMSKMLAEITKVSAMRDEVTFDREGKSHFVRSDRERAVLGMQAEQLARSRALQARVLEEAQATHAAQRARQAAEVERSARIEQAAVARAEALEVERRAEQILKARGGHR